MNTRICPHVTTLALFVATVLTSSVPAADFQFNRDIRPILSDHCFHCHGPDVNQRKARLRLDSEAGSRADLGGHSAVIPGDAPRSELIRRIHSEDPDEVMPPPEMKRTLTAMQKDPES